MIVKTYEDLEGAKILIDAANANEKAKKIANKVFNKEYVMVDEDGKYFINDMLIKLELYTYKLEKCIYKDGISIMKNYNNNGIVTTAPEYDKIDGKISTKAKKLSFKEAFLKYVELNNAPFRLGNDELDYLVMIQPLIVDAYYKLGVDRVRNLRYIKKAVEDALVNLDADKSNEDKVAKLLQSRVEIGFNTTTALQAALTDAYSIVGISRKVKASDIEKYFDAKSLTKRIDGKVTRGYEIYRSKIVFR